MMAAAPERQRQKLKAGTVPLKKRKGQDATEVALSALCSKKEIDTGYLVFAVVLALLLFWVVHKADYNAFVVPEEGEPCDETCMDRRVRRGMLGIVICGVVFGIIVATVDAQGADAATSGAFISLVLGNVFGFLLDNSIGTNAAVREWQKGYQNGFRYTMGTVYSNAFARFVVTVILDMFVSVILLKFLLEVVIRLPFFRCGTWPGIAAKLLCGSAVCTLTFAAYANLTRFGWAYPDKKQDALPPIAIMLSVTTLGITFFNTHTGHHGINNPSVKFGILIFALFLLAFLQIYGGLNKNFDEDAQKVITRTKANATKGKAMFLGIAALCILATFSTVPATRGGLVGRALPPTMYIALASFVFWAQYLMPKDGALDSTDGASQ